MKKQLFSLSFLLVSVAVCAGPRSIEQMKDAARTVLGGKGAVTTRGLQANVEVLEKAGQFTVIGYKDGGYAFIANDDRINAVLGYSQSKFDTDDMPPALRWWMQVADESIDARLASGNTAAAPSNYLSVEYPDMVNTLMSTTWNQDRPYNDIVTDKLGAEYPTGCMATAMAQVMKYHNWPITGTDYHSYRCKPEGASSYIRLVADFENTTYQWENMIDNYDSYSVNYTDAQAEAVATVMFHCGVAVDMAYNLDGSGAYSYDAAKALRDYFKYSAKLYTRDIYTEAEWMDIVYGELSAGRPVLYTGADLALGGHAFVFDGYDADGLVHVNWGWGGVSDGYYDVAILNSGNGNYSYGQVMIVMHDADEPAITYSSEWGFIPELTWISSGSGQTFTTTGRFEVSVSGNMLSFECGNLANCDADDFTGELSLTAANTDGGQPVQLVSTSVKNISYNNTYPGNAQDYVGTADISALADGTYRVYFASKSTSEAEWQPVRSNETITNNYILTISGGVATVTAGEPGWTTGIQGIEAAEAGGDGIVRVYTADGVLVYESSVGSFSLSDVPARGMLIVKNGAKTTKIMK